MRAVFAFFAYAGSRDNAEDLTSATFERVVRAWERYDPTLSAERTWIMSIARNVLTDHFRRQKHRASASLDERPELLEREAADDPFARVVDADLLRRVLPLVSEREREVLALRYGADLPAAEVGALLEMSEANVHQVASRGLRRLRAAIAADQKVSGSA